jgi:uncharacterized membrane protein
MFFKNSPKARHFFVTAALIAGLLCVFLNPPFQTPDEPAHFYRAWQISEGKLISEKADDRVGGQLPANLEIFAREFSQVNWNGFNFSQNIMNNGLIKMKPDADAKKFIDFNNTALYSPVCYAPASLALFILRQFNVSLPFLFWGARLASLLFWVGMVYLAIRLIPVYQWLFTLLALLPMSVFINSSISADVVTNAVCFLFTAILLKYIFEKKEIQRQRAFILIVMVIALVSVKAAYSPLILLLLLLGKGEKNKKIAWLKISGLFFLGVFVAWLWHHMTDLLYLSYANYNVSHRDSAALVKDADMHAQMNYITSHGTYLLDVLYASVSYAFPMYSNGYIGTFGWLDLPLPAVFIISFYLIILIIACSDIS